MGYIPLSTLDEYENANSKLRFLCPTHGEQSVAYNHIQQNDGCPMCGKERIGQSFKQSVDSVINLVESKNGTILNPQDYVNMLTKNLQIKCNICGDINISSLYNVYNSSGDYVPCKICGKRRLVEYRTLSKDNLVKHFNNNGHILLNPEDYINNTTMNLKIECPQCGQPYTTSLASYNGGKIRCDKCSNSQSIGEYIIAEILDKYKINYIPEYKFPDCKDIRCLPFDFYLPDFNCCLEFDGQHHFFPVYGMDSLINTIRHDQMKNKFCHDNKIRLIRIPYWEGNDIEQILSEELGFHVYNKIKYSTKTMNHIKI